MFTGWERPSHWLVLAVVVAILFGYKKLPDAARSVGRSLRIFKTEIKGMSEDDAARAKQAGEVPAAPSATAPAPSAPAPSAPGPSAPAQSAPIQPGTTESTPSRPTPVEPGAASAEAPQPAATQPGTPGPEVHEASAAPAPDAVHHSNHATH